MGNLFKYNWDIKLFYHMFKQKDTRKRIIYEINFMNKVDKHFCFQLSLLQKHGGPWPP